MIVAATHWMAQNANAARLEPDGAVTVTNRHRGVRNGASDVPHFQHPWADRSRSVFLVADYTIAAIPTLYRGRMYRSRLEARWAAFFDRLGWQYEYEPFDLGAWSPDFAITDPFDALIEIKPLTEPDYDLFERVQGAGSGRGGVFVMGVAPTRIKTHVRLGWWAASYQPVFLVWAPEPDEPVFKADFLSFTSDAKNWVTCNNNGGTLENFPGAIDSYADHTMGLWADASNAVQWEPRQ
jgi:hypothetical protein